MLFVWQQQTDQKIVWKKKGASHCLAQNMKPIAINYAQAVMNKMNFKPRWAIKLNPPYSRYAEET